MSNKKLTDEELAAAAAAETAAKEEAERAASKAHLVTMTKGGQSLKVHPTCVNAHIAKGWSL